MRVLVSGRSGLLGSAIAERLRVEHEVVGVDRVPGPFTTRVGRVQDRGFIVSTMAGVEAVVHTASLQAPDVGRVPRQEFVDVNVGGTLHLLEAAATHGVRRFPEPPNVVAVNRLSRGVDLRDAVAAHLLALHDDTTPFGVFNISARSPFTEGDVDELLVDAPSVIRRSYPWAEAAFATRGWRLPASVDRVYVVAKAETLLGYRPAYGFGALFPEHAAEDE